MTEDEMVGGHRHNVHESEAALGDREGQGRLAAAVHDVTKHWTQLSDQVRTTTK